MTGNLSMPAPSNALRAPRCDARNPDGDDMKRFSLALALLAASALPALAAEDVAKAPPAPPYQQVSRLVNLPDFVPGLGQLFVDPASLPAGPFRAYDHDGKLVSTIYMVPVEELNPDKTFNDLAVPG